MSEYREFRDAADVFAACCPKAKHFDGDCAAANRLYPILEKIRERAVSTADDPRDAEIAKLREALTNITTEIVKSTDLAVRMVEAKAWASCALNLSLSRNRINGIAVQALAEPEGKP